MQVPIRTIVFPVDFSMRSRLAAPHVRAVAQRYGATVVTIHAVDPASRLIHALESPDSASDELRARWVADARARLDTFVQREFAGVKVDQVVEQGEAGRLIVDTAQRRDATWIMMPTHGFSVFRRFILGSVAAQVLHAAQCPVWTAAIHEESQDAPQCEPKEIVVAVAFRDQDEEVVRYAANLAADCGAALTVAHATPLVAMTTPDWSGHGINEQITQQAFQALGLMLERLGIQAHIAVRGGDVERALGQIATERHADLIVIARGSAADGMGRLRAHSYGIINQAPCPVLSI